MGYYILSTPDGQKWDVPDTIREEEAFRRLKESNPEAFAKEPDEEPTGQELLREYNHAYVYDPSNSYASDDDPGFFSSLLGGFFEGVAEFPKAFAYTAAGASDSEELYNVTKEKSDEFDKFIDTIAPSAGRTSFYDIGDTYDREGLLSAAGSSWDWLRQTTGQVLGYMAPVIAAGTTASYFASGTPLAPVAIPLSIFGTLLLQHMGNLYNAQIESGVVEDADDINVLKTLAGAAPSAVLDTIIFTATGIRTPTGALSPKGILGSLVGIQPSTAVQQKISKTLGRTILDGIARGIIIEPPTEVAQQVIERLLRGDPISPFDAGALREYIEVGAAAAVAGPLLGTAGGFMQNRLAQGNTNSERVLRSALERRVEQGDVAAEEEIQRLDQQFYDRFNQELNSITERGEEISASQQDIILLAEDKNINIGRRGEDTGFRSFLLRTFNKSKLSDLNAVERGTLYATISQMLPQSVKRNFNISSVEDVDLVETELHSRQKEKNRPEVVTVKKVADILDLPEGTDQALSERKARSIIGRLRARGQVHREDNKFFLSPEKVGYTEDQYHRAASAVIEAGQFTDEVVTEATAIEDQKVIKLIRDDMDRRGHIKKVGPRYLPVDPRKAEGGPSVYWRAKIRKRDGTAGVGRSKYPTRDAAVAAAQKDLEKYQEPIRRGTPGVVRSDMTDPRLGEPVTSQDIDDEYDALVALRNSQNRAAAEQLVVPQVYSPILRNLTTDEELTVSTAPMFVARDAQGQIRTARRPLRTKTGRFVNPFSTEERAAFRREGVQISSAPENVSMVEERFYDEDGRLQQSRLASTTEDKVRGIEGGRPAIYATRDEAISAMGREETARKARPSREAVAGRVVPLPAEVAGKLRAVRQAPMEAAEAQLRAAGKLNLDKLVELFGMLNKVLQNTIGGKGVSLSLERTIAGALVDEKSNDLVRGLARLPRDLALKDLRGYVVKENGDISVAETYYTIRLALDAVNALDKGMTVQQAFESLKPTLYHEIFHVMSAMDLFTEHERKLISDYVSTKIIPFLKKNPNYIDLANREKWSLRDWEEEAAAHMVEWYAKNPGKLSGQQASYIRRAFDTVRKIGLAFAGEEIYNIDQLIQAIGTGYIGQRSNQEIRTIMLSNSPLESVKKLRSEAKDWKPPLLAREAAEEPPEEARPVEGVPIEGESTYDRRRRSLGLPVLGRAALGPPAPRTAEGVEPTGRLAVGIDEAFNEGNVDNKLIAEKLDVSKLKRLRGGTTRDVYPIDGKVVKVAKSARGLEQNLSMGFGDKFLIGVALPELYEVGKDYIVTENVPRNDTATRKFLKPLQKFSVLDWDNKIPELQDVLVEMGLDGFMNYELLWADFKAYRNWGQRDNGEFVLVDEGALNKNVTASSIVQDWAKKEWEVIKEDRREVSRQPPTGRLAIAGELTSKDFKRGPDFEFDGGYVAQVHGGTVVIFRDSGETGWFLDNDDSGQPGQPPFPLGWTKAEAIEELNSRFRRTGRFTYAPVDKVTPTGRLAIAGDLESPELVRYGLPIQRDTEALFNIDLDKETISRITRPNRFLNRQIIETAEATPESIEEILSYIPIGIEGTGTNGRVTVDDISRALNDWSQIRLGRPITMQVPIAEAFLPESSVPPDFWSPEWGETIDESDLIKALAMINIKGEVEFMLAQPDAEVAKEWYRNVLMIQDKLLGAIHPELKNKHNLILFKQIEVIFSNGIRPDQSLRTALRVYEAAKAIDSEKPFENLPPYQDSLNEKGEPKGWSRRRPTNAMHLVRLSQLVKDKGRIGAAKWLLADHKVGPKHGSAKGVRKDTIHYYNNSFKAAEDVSVPGSFIFGEKLGPFFQNINGRHEYLTKDIWFARSWNRVMGTLVNPDGSIIADPRNPKERKIMDAAVKEVADVLNLRVDQLQAVWWYYEQLLYRALGARSPSDNFADAATKVIQERNIILKREGKKEIPLPRIRGFRFTDEEGWQSTDVKGVSVSPTTTTIPTPREWRVSSRDIAERFAEQQTAEPVGRLSISRTAEDVVPTGRFAIEETDSKQKAKEIVDEIEESLPAISGKLEVNTERLLDQLGSMLYKENAAQVAAKEITQNAFDAIKEKQHKGFLDGPGEIKVTVDQQEYSITVEDNGIGMTPEIVQQAFFTIFGTQKELPPELSSGGFGMAKMAFLLSSKRVELDTIRDGIRTKVTATPAEIKQNRFEIKRYRTKESSGTKVKIVFERKMTDKSTGSVKKIHLTKWGPSFLKEPLIGNVNFELINIDEDGNSEDATRYLGPVGNRFDTDRMKHFTTVNFDWGTADIYMGVERVPVPQHKILSAGVYQFRWYQYPDINTLVPYDMVIDFHPKGRAGETQYPYPFNMQREDFNILIEDDIKALSAYLMSWGAGRAAQETSDTFSRATVMSRADFDNVINDPDRVAPRFIPTAPPEPLTPDELDEYSKRITIEAGEISGIGRSVKKSEVDNILKRRPTFKAEKKGPSAAELVGSKDIDPTVPLFLNNTNMNIPDSARGMLSEIGSLVTEFKERVVDSNVFGFEVFGESDNPYATGVEIQKGRAGVHVGVPYRAFFLNPFENNAQNADGVVAAWLHVLEHEMSHYNAGHNATHTSNMYGLAIALGDFGIQNDLDQASHAILDKYWEEYISLRREYEKSTTRNIKSALEPEYESEEELQFYGRLPRARGARSGLGRYAIGGLGERIERGEEIKPEAVGATALDVIHSNLVKDKPSTGRLSLGIEGRSRLLGNAPPLYEPVGRYAHNPVPYTFDENFGLYGKTFEELAETPGARDQWGENILELIQLDNTHHLSSSDDGFPGGVVHEMVADFSIVNPNTGTNVIYNVDLALKSLGTELDNQSIEYIRSILKPRYIDERSEISYPATTLDISFTAENEIDGVIVHNYETSPTVANKVISTVYDISIEGIEKIKSKSLDGPTAITFFASAPGKDIANAPGQLPSGREKLYSRIARRLGETLGYSVFAERFSGQSGTTSSSSFLAIRTSALVDPEIDIIDDRYFRIDRPQDREKIEEDIRMGYKLPVRQREALRLAKGVRGRMAIGEVAESRTLEQERIHAEERKNLSDRPAVIDQGPSQSSVGQEIHDYLGRIGFLRDGHIALPNPVGNVTTLSDLQVGREQDQRVENYQAVQGYIGNTINPEIDTAGTVRFYGLVGAFGKTRPQIDVAIRNYLERIGWKHRIIGPNEQGKGFTQPDFNQWGYWNNNIWIYQPWSPNLGLAEYQYLFPWRITHELGHALTNNQMSEMYGGMGRRAGALGLIVTDAYQRPSVPLSLADGLRSLDWEAAAFKRQRQILEQDFGLQITEEEFRKENARNLADTSYKLLSGYFGVQGSSVVPEPIDPDLALQRAKDLIRAAAYEMGMNQSERLDNMTEGGTSDEYSIIHQQFAPREEAELGSQYFGFPGDDNTLRRNREIISGRFAMSPTEYNRARDVETNWFATPRYFTRGVYQGILEVPENLTTGRFALGTQERPVEVNAALNAMGAVPTVWSSLLALLEVLDPSHSHTVWNVGPNTKQDIIDKVQSVSINRWGASIGTDRPEMSDIEEEFLETIHDDMELTEVDADTFNSTMMLWGSSFSEQVNQNIKQKPFFNAISSLLIPYHGNMSEQNRSKMWFDLSFKDKANSIGGMNRTVYDFLYDALAVMPESIKGIKTTSQDREWSNYQTISGIANPRARIGQAVQQFKTAMAMAGMNDINDLARQMGIVERWISSYGSGVLPSGVFEWVHGTEIENMEDIIIELYSAIGMHWGSGIQAIDRLDTLLGSNDHSRRRYIRALINMQYPIRFPDSGDWEPSSVLGPFIEKFSSRVSSYTDFNLFSDNVSIEEFERRADRIEDGISDASMERLNSLGIDPFNLSVLWHLRDKVISGDRSPISISYSNDDGIFKSSIVLDMTVSDWIQKMNDTDFTLPDRHDIVGSDNLEFVDKVFRDPIEALMVGKGKGAAFALPQSITDKIFDVEFLEALSRFIRTEDVDMPGSFLRTRLDWLIDIISDPQVNIDRLRTIFSTPITDVMVGDYRDSGWGGIIGMMDDADVENSGEASSISHGEGYDIISDGQYKFTADRMNDIIQSAAVMMTLHDLWSNGKRFDTINNIAHHFSGISDIRQRVRASLFGTTVSQQPVTDVVVGTEVAGETYAEYADRILMRSLGTYSNELIRSFISSFGFDGIVYNNESEGMGDSVIAFNKKQIQILAPDEFMSDFIYGGKTPKWFKAIDEKLGIRSPPEGPSPKPLLQSSLFDGDDQAHAKTPSEMDMYIPKFGNGATDRDIEVANNPELATHLPDSVKGRFSLSARESEGRSEPRSAEETRVINQTVPANPSGNLWDRLKRVFQDDWVLNFRELALDKYERIERVSQRVANEQSNLSRKMGFSGTRNMADAAAISAVRMIDQAKVYLSAVLKYGSMSLIVTKDGSYSKVEDFKLISDAAWKYAKTHGGIMEIFSPLYQDENGKPRNLSRDFQTVAIMRRARRMKMEKGKPAVVGIDEKEFAVADSLVEKYPVLETVYKNYEAWNKKMIQYMVDGEIVTPEIGEKFREYMDYIPFYRDQLGQDDYASVRQWAKEEVGNENFRLFESLITPKPLKRLKQGPKDNFMEMFEGISRNSLAIITAVLKNTAGQRLMAELEYLGEAIKLPEGELKDARAFSIRVNGEEVWFQVKDPLMAQSLMTAQDGFVDFPSYRFGAFASRTLRELVTRNPAFWVRNMLRDTLAVWTISGAKFRPFTGTIKMFLKNWKAYKSGEVESSFKELEKLGIIGGYELGRAESIGKIMERRFAAQAGKKGPTTRMWQLWDALGEYSSFSEAATRQLIFNEGLATHQNETQASYAAMEILNFSRRGGAKGVRFIMGWWPFLNARVQGVDVLYRGARGKLNLTQQEIGMFDAMGLARSFVLRFSILAGFSSIWALLTADMDDDENIRKEILDDNWLIPMPGKIPPIGIPIPFEVGVLAKVIPENFVRYMLGTRNGHQVYNSLKHAAVSQFAISPLPQFAEPLAESLYGYSLFTGRRIVPFYMEEELSAEQYKPTTNTLAVKLGQATNISPLKIEHVMRGYTGSLGNYAMIATDFMLRGAGVAPVLPLNYWKLPFVRDAFKYGVGEGLESDFYDFRESINAVVTSVDKYKRTGQLEKAWEIQREYQSLYSLKDAKNAIDRQLVKIRRERTLVILSSMSARQKNEANERLDERVKYILRNVPELYKRADIPIGFPISNM